ncbi:MAG: carboxypeptidase regulatory-like domain-containing protein [Wenzhouxiangella sp.]
MKLVSKLNYLLAIGVCCLLLSASVATAGDQLFVEPGLDARIQSGEQVDLLVQFQGMPDLTPAYSMEWEERGRWVFGMLEEAVDRYQSRMAEQFKRQGVEFESLRLGNMMIVRQAGPQAFNELLSAIEVQAIYAKPEFELMPESEGFEPAPLGGTPVLNLEQIAAPEAWAQFGAEGEGITIGLNDSSPRHTHNLMVDTYRGNQGDGTFDHNYAWFDPTSGAPAPVADFHGTLVLSIMVGDDGNSRTGVAPGAEWMACRGCQGTGCAGVIQCLNWFVAPTDVSGNNPDPDRRPMIVNNSWGSCDQSYNAGLYEPIWDSMYAAGVIPYISNGNSGNCGYSSPPGLNTVGNPARGGRVMGIGSTTITGDVGNYAIHSNWGPTDNPNPGIDNGSFDHFGFPDLKPNVVAPGQGVPGAGSGSDTATTSNTGTSFASPHVAGAAAVMMSAAPCLIGDHVRINTILQATATPIDYDSGGPNPGPGNIPNYATGWGEINLLAAVDAAVAECGPRGTISGSVTDAVTGAPIQGVNVFVENPNPPPADWMAFTDEDGLFTLDLTANEPGETYTVEFARNGYVDTVELDVVVEEGEITNLTITMDPQPGVDITGVIDDANTGDVVQASVLAIDDDGFTYGPVLSDAATGEYTLTLPSGENYELEVFAEGYETAVRDLGLVDDAQTQDFTLNAGIIELPATAAFSVDRGDVGSTSVTIENTGTADAEITLFLSGAEIDPGFVEDFEGSFPPAGWTVANDDPNGCPWERTDDIPMDNLAGSGEGAANNSDECGSGSTTDSSLITPSFSLADVAQAELTFLGVYRHLGGSSFEVDISTDGGASWTNELTWTSSQSPNGPGIEVSIDLEDYLGESDVQARFRYQAGWDWWAVIDDVAVVATGASFAFVDPATVTVPQGGSVTVDLLADATNLAVGDYQLSLNVVAGSAYPVDATDVTLTVEAVPEIVLPEVIEMTVEFPTTDSTSISIDNVGGADGDVSLTFEVEPLFEDFEGSDFPPAGWTVVDDGSGCPWQTTDDYPMVTFPGLIAGSNRGAAVDSDSCGQGVQADTSLISPVLNLASSEPATLEFAFAQNDFGGTTTTVEATTDGGATWTVLRTYTGAVNHPGGAQVETVDLAPLAGNSEVQIRFRYVAGWDWYVYVDNVSIDLPAVDWAIADPDQVTVLANDSESVDVVVDSSLLDGPGVYEAFLFGSVDSPFAITPSQLIVTVVPGADLAGISGNVQSAGYCNDNPFDAAGAEITIVGVNDSYTATADENGDYLIFIPSDESPVSITASAPDHISFTEDDVDLVPADTINVDFTLELDAPCIETSPFEFTSSIEPNQVDTQTLTIANTDGSGALEWNIDTASPDAAASPTGPIAAGVGSGLSGHTQTLSSLWDGEAGRSLGFAPMTLINCDEAPGLVITDDGDIDNGYSGNPAVADNVTVIQAFEADADRMIGVVCVSFVSLGPSERDFEIVVFDNSGAGGAPGVELGAVAGTATGMSTGLPDTVLWHTVDLSGLGIQVNAGDTVYIGARWAVSDPNVFIASDEEGPGGNVGYFRVDTNDWDQLGTDAFPDFRALFVRPQLMQPGGCDAIGDVPWLSADPDSGTVAAGDSSDIDVIIDSSGLLPGDYEATLCVFSNDSVAGVIAVPVSLTVEAPASFATITGQVNSQGYCDENPFPAAGAQVEVVGDSGTVYTVTADGDGVYSLAIDSAESPVEITASAPDHLDGSEDGVVLVASETTVVDFDLQIIAGCTSNVQESFEVTLPLGGGTTELLTLLNEGLAESSFTLSAIDMGTAIADPVSVELQRVGHPGGDFTTDASSRAGVIDAAPAEIREVVISPQSTVSVVVLSPDDVPPTNLVTALNSFPDINAELYPGDLTTVTGADLAGYDVAVTTNNNQWAAAGADVSVGNALADFVDDGGKVVLFNFAFDWFGFELAGRYIAEEYGPFNLSTADATGTVTMNILETDHPIFEGVTSLESGTIRINVTPQDDAELIAEWSDGQALIAFNDYAVGFNAMYSDNGADAWTGDLDIMAYNAVMFLASGGADADWLGFDPAEGSVSAGGSTEVDVVFDASDLPAGTYLADIQVELDEGAGQSNILTIPVTLVIEAVDNIFQDRFENGN